jgi:hypothetical protein
MKTENYMSQLGRWPRTGRHIMAQYDDHGIIVYQAYRPAIGHFAARHGYFGGEYKLSRMGWIKPNFLWMMYRCGWGVKADQEVVLAVTIKRTAFDEILSQAVYSSFVAGGRHSHAEWKQQVADSSVRLQWDPDHDPHGGKQQRQAIQLGLSGEVLKAYAREWILKIEDISQFVAEGRALLAEGRVGELITPSEDVYPVAGEKVARHLGIDTCPKLEVSL